MPHVQTDSSLGTESCPLRVAIIGAGPSGFYAAASLLKSSPSVQVHLFEKLPTPYGLVRFGVAPDHAKIRNVVKKYEQIASDPNCHYWGNVSIGQDLLIDELREHFDAIILAYGANADRRLGIAGEDFERSYSATAFCGWYNGHPDYADVSFDLSQEVAVIAGQGNVAMDVARILAKPAEELRQTDMATYAINALAESRVREIHMIGRRGPVQAAFTPKEIKELAEITDCDLVIDPKSLELGSVCRDELALPDRQQARKNYEIMQKIAADTEAAGTLTSSQPGRRRIVLSFLKSTHELIGDGQVESVKIEQKRMEGPVGQQRSVGTGQYETWSAGLFFCSIGYRGEPLMGASSGVPWDEQRCIVPNESGRVERGLYVAGWIKRGPSGLIGTNKKDSEVSVQQLLDELADLTPAPVRSDQALVDRLRERGVRWVTHEEWLKIDAAEIERGQALGKLRENFVTVDEMLSVLD